MSKPVMNEVPFGLDQDWKPDQYWSITSKGMFCPGAKELGVIGKGPNVLVIFKDEDMAERWKVTSKNISSDLPLFQADLDYWMAIAKKMGYSAVLLVLEYPIPGCTFKYDYWTVPQ
jgi:hypothetical protein